MRALASADHSLPAGLPGQGLRPSQAGDEIIDGLDYRPQGAQKLYFVGDVAERLKLYIVKGGV